MIARIKLTCGDGDVDYTFEQSIGWHLSDVYDQPLQPQAGMTVIIPQGKESFRFHIDHIIADLRTAETVLIEQRDFDHNWQSEQKMNKIVERLRVWGWEEE